MSTDDRTRADAEPNTGGPRLFLAGSVLVDLVVRIPALPERGGDMLAESAEFTTGGGFNLLSAAGRLGLPGTYAGPHGTGTFGDRTRASLAAEGIDLLLPARTGQDTGFSIALVDSDERTFVTSSGAEADFTDADTEALAARLRPGDVVQISGYGLVRPATGETLAALVGRLPDGVLLSFDPGPLVGDIPPARLDRILARCDWLSCNAREAGLLTAGASGREAAQALRARLRPGAGVVVRADSDGCWVAPPAAGDRADVQAPVHLPGFEVTAVDANGAGDAHVGAFLAFLTQGADPLEAARKANAAAAYAVTRRGPATAPDRPELNRFLATATTRRVDGSGRPLVDCSSGAAQDWAGKRFPKLSHVCSQEEPGATQKVRCGRARVGRGDGRRGDGGEDGCPRAGRERAGGRFVAHAS